jgi:hypothetical protein
MDCELDFAQKSYNVFVLDSSDIAWNDGMCQQTTLANSRWRFPSIYMDRPKINLKYPVRILVSGPKFEPHASTSIEPYQYINLFSLSL